MVVVLIVVGVVALIVVASIVGARRGTPMARAAGRIHGEDVGQITSS